MSRKSKGFILVPIFLSMVFVGLFFAVTDPTSWPIRATVLAATDMNLVPSVSTVWCESVVLSANHDFLAYKVDAIPKVSSKLSRNSIDVEAKFSRRRHQPLEIRYFMLPGSVLSVFACASDSHAYLRIYQGLIGIECANAARRPLLSSEMDSDESEEEKSSGDKNDLCLEPIKEAQVPSPYGEEECLRRKPISINVTRADYFIIFVTNHRSSSNKVRVKLSLDRTSYNLNESKDVIHKCSDGSRCVIPLTFASEERIVVIIPPEPDAGKNVFDVQSRCYPRIALFAVLTFAFPNILFAMLAYLICKSPVFRAGRSVRQNISPPLIVRTQTRGQSQQSEDFLEPVDSGTVHYDGPPSYEGLYEDPPPPYSSLVSSMSSNRR